MDKKDGFGAVELFGNKVNLYCYNLNMAEADINPCEDKMTFDTKEQAAGSAVVASWQHGTKLKPYQCKNCGHWHLTSI